VANGESFLHSLWLHSHCSFELIHLMEVEVVEVGDDDGGDGVVKKKTRVVN
jgi:hypothetical protein